jgi:hypothetical protein
MPHKQDEQLDKVTVVDVGKIAALGNRTTASRRLTAVACVDCRKRKRKVSSHRRSKAPQDLQD